MVGRESPASSGNDRPDMVKILPSTSFDSLQVILSHFFKKLYQ